MWHGLNSMLAGSFRAGQSRSSVLNPLQWTLSILLVGVLAAAVEHVERWIVIVLVFCFASVLGLLLVAYVYFMRNEPHHLRSERLVSTPGTLDYDETKKHAAGTGSAIAGGGSL
jgi:hypothetical protein